VVPAELHRAAQHRLELLGGGIGRVRTRLRRNGPLPVAYDLVHHDLEEVLLALEEAVEKAVADPGIGGDGLHGGPAEALGAEAGTRGLQDPPALLLALLPPTAATQGAPRTRFLLQIQAVLHH